MLTLASSEDPDEMLHSSESTLFARRKTIFRERIGNCTIILAPLYKQCPSESMEYPKLIVSNQKEETMIVVNLFINGGPEKLEKMAILK